LVVVGEWLTLGRRQCFVYHPAPIRRLRALAWGAIGVIHGVNRSSEEGEGEGVVLNREAKLWRHVTNAEAVVELFRSRVTTLRWSLEVSEGCGLAETTRKVRCWCVLVTPEGTNCFRVVLLEEGSVYVEMRPCYHDGFHWVNNARLLGVKTVWVRHAKMLHGRADFNARCPGVVAERGTEADLVLLGQAAEVVRRYESERKAVPVGQGGWRTCRQERGFKSQAV
jgi:hypothetical protein